jgi:hypothetical protein
MMMQAVVKWNQIKPGALRRSLIIHHLHPLPPPTHNRRSYIKKNYEELKMLNPTTPFLVRDGWPGKAPYVVATYDWGKEVRKELPRDEAQIDATVRSGWCICAWAGRRGGGGGGEGPLRALRAAVIDWTNWVFVCFFNWHVWCGVDGSFDRPTIFSIKPATKQPNKRGEWSMFESVLQSMLHSTNQFIIIGQSNEKSDSAVTTPDRSTHLLVSNSFELPTPTPSQLKALVEEGKSMPKFSDPPLSGRPKPIVDAGRDAFY